jgi:tRNA(Ile)-lysidine synthase
MTELLSAHSISSALNQSNNLKHIYVGYSGGVDSHVLLHLCTAITDLKDKITAVYVHHGLQLEADAWSKHCKKTAERLGVNFIELHVNAVPGQGESPEEAARNARYNALKPLIKADDVLLVAQHRDDQLETVLLQLFRGSGLQGLSAMPESMVFGQGLMLRPLLNVSKSTINDYAQVHALSWVDDPSNFSNDYDRNFLRNEVLPLIKKRWPACDKTVARSAKHCANAQVLISLQAEKLFLEVYDDLDKTLVISELKKQTIDQQALVIRQWFQTLNLKMPAQAFIKGLQSEVIAAREDADPVLSGQGYSVRRYRDKLYCLKVVAPEILPHLIWPAGQSSIKFSAYQTLSCIASLQGIPLEQWEYATVTVRPRSGGETIALKGRAGHHDLKKLFQEAAIPPWQRQSIPLVYIDDKLAAVGDLWISADFYNDKAQNCIRVDIQRE